MSPLAWLSLLGGLALLLVGAELLVRGASRLAAALGIAPLVIGLTVVAYGTSAPELAVSVRAGLAGSAGLAVGNVLGSNLFNILLVLGLSSLLVPLDVSRKLIRIDVPILVAVTTLAYVLALDGRLGRGDGAVLLALAAAYTGLQVFAARRPRSGTERAGDGAGEGSREGAGGSWPVQVALVLGGLALLVVGAGWLVEGAVAMARWLGVGETLIGLTIVAAGTSLPEVATSIVAGVRGERDLATGNVVGSDIFNVLVVLGAAGALSPRGLPIPEQALRFDFPVALAAAFACLPIFFTGHRIARWEGALFLAYYAAYVLYLFLSAARRPSLAAFERAMLVYVIPLTAVTLATVTVRALRHGRAGGAGG